LKQDFDRTSRWIADPSLLPQLRRLSAIPQDAMAFIEDRPVSQLTLEYPDLFGNYQTVYSALPLSQFRSKVPITFFQAAPAQWLHGPCLARYLPQLETAAIIQDGSWTTSRGLLVHYFFSVLTPCSYSLSANFRDSSQNWCRPSTFCPS
jgi:hypothetical protein